MRTLIEEPDSHRFRISQQDLPVVDEQLFAVSDLSSHVNNFLYQDYLLVSGLDHSDLSEQFSYQIDFANFKVT